MIELKVENYCQNCPDFEAAQKKDSCYYEDLLERCEIVNITVYCEFAERCKAMKRYLEKHSK